MPFSHAALQYKCMCNVFIYIKLNCNLPLFFPKSSNVFLVGQDSGTMKWIYYSDMLNFFSFLLVIASYAEFISHHCFQYIKNDILFVRLIHSIGFHKAQV